MRRFNRPYRAFLCSIRIRWRTFAEFRRYGYEPLEAVGFLDELGGAPPEFNRHRSR